MKKNENLITIISIIIYVVLNSYCIQNFGVANYKTTLINIALLTILLIYVYKNKLNKYYGLTKITKYKEYLYYIPLLVIASVNIWSGIKITITPSEIIFYILSMLTVGFLEELIFRGFLYKLLAKENVKKAMIISSITFGIGHIVNLLNGAPLVPTLLQICYAISLGYLFVLIFNKSNSLLPAIITHSIINSLGFLNVTNKVSTYLIPVILIIISSSYSLYINKKVK